MRPEYLPIENYGVIGDLTTVALVSMDGSIDFMCFPRFDSPTIFAAILDRKKGGYFQIAPLDNDAKNKQIYLPQTNVLLTRFLSPDGVTEVSDFMPTEDQCPGHDLVRRVKCVRGTSHVRVVCAPRFNYARSGHTVEAFEGGVIFRSNGPDGTVLRLRSPEPLKVEDDGSVVAEFTLHAGDTRGFILEQAIGAHADAPSASQEFVSETFKQTLTFWRDWIGKMKYQGRWREMMERSALALKLLDSRPHGSIIASPTFGLPEQIGGVRNWDYRYTWIRDASFTLYALIRLGYTEEAEKFMDWIAERCNELSEEGTLNIMYAIDGRKELTEETLDHLEGYRGSKPVRIGNGAYDQLQLDIYGELMDAVYLYDKYGARISHELWRNLTRLMNWLCRNWHLPDEGIWEVRGGRKKFLFSRVMCWVALDRAVRLSMKRSLPAPLQEWISTRDQIYRTIHKDFWNPRIGAFTQSQGSTYVDSSALLMPLMRFIGAKDPRWLSTLRVIENDLVEDSLVYRYKNHDHDGLDGEEGTFSMCTFWYVECLSRAGDIEKARLVMEKMLGYANHLGLYGEELGARGEHLGNFPQAFTHLGFISAAFDLDRRLSGFTQTS